MVQLFIQDSTGVDIPEDLIISLEGDNPKRLSVFLQEQSEPNQGIINDFLGLFSDIQTKIDNVCPEGLTVEFTINKATSSDSVETDYLVMGVIDKSKIDSFLNYISEL